MKNYRQLYNMKAQLRQKIIGILTDKKHTETQKLSANFYRLLRRWKAAEEITLLSDIPQKHMIFL